MDKKWKIIIAVFSLVSVIALAFSIKNKKDAKHTLWFTIFSIITAIIGIEIHGNIFFSLINFIFAPLSWLIWLITHTINVTIITNAFEFFFN